MHCYIGDSDTEAAAESDAEEFDGQCSEAEALDQQRREAEACAATGGPGGGAAVPRDSLYLSAYRLLVLRGKVSPTVADVKELMEVRGFVVDQDMVGRTVAAASLRGDNITIWNAG